MTDLSQNIEVAPLGSASSEGPPQTVGELEAQEQTGLSESDHEQLEQEVQEAIENGASEKEVKNLIKEFNLKVNGKTYSRKIDLSDEKAVARELQKAIAGQHAMEEIAKLKDLYAQDLDVIRTNPIKALQALGIDFDELAYDYMNQKVEESSKTPEEIERETLKRELEETRARLKAQEDAAQAERMALYEKEAAKNLEDEITTALNSHKTLPKSTFTVKKIADTMLWAIDAGWKDVTVEDVLPTVEAEIRREITGFIENLPEEVFEAYLGKKTNERLRQKRLKAVKKVENLSNVKKTIPDASKKPQETKPNIKFEDYWFRD
jgi:hypothetical protein